MRLAFSVAAHLNPEIVILDEVLAVGDAVFQKYVSIAWKRSSTKVTPLFWSVTPRRFLQRMSQVCMWPRHGRVEMFGADHEVVVQYEKPTTHEIVSNLEKPTAQPQDATHSVADCSPLQLEGRKEGFQRSAHDHFQPRKESPFISKLNWPRPCRTAKLPYRWPMFRGLFSAPTLEELRQTKARQIYVGARAAAPYRQARRIHPKLRDFRRNSCRCVSPCRPGINGSRRKHWRRHRLPRRPEFAGKAVNRLAIVGATSLV